MVVGLLVLNCVDKVGLVKFHYSASVEIFLTVRPTRRIDDVGNLLTRNLHANNECVQGA